MKNLSKILGIATVVLMLTTTILAGCGKEDEATNTSTSSVTQKATEQQADKIDTSKEVNLKMVLLGDKPRDFDEVYSEVNKKLKADINATVETDFLSWGDWKTKYPLMFASGEDFDLIYTSNWAFYLQQSIKDGFVELSDELVSKYAPKTYEEVPKAAWDNVLVNGKRYMIPFTKKEFGNYTFVVRGDLRAKYNVPEIKNADDFAVYLDAIAKNEKTMVPYDISSQENYTLKNILFETPNTLYPIANYFYFNYADAASSKLMYPNTELASQLAATDKKIKEWKDKGYWSKDALVSKTMSKDSFLAGKSASTIQNLLTANSVYMTAMAKHPEWKVEVYDSVNGKATIPNAYSNNGMAIHNGSKNVERALMLLDLFRNDKDYFDLTTYGIKGKHWEPVGDDKFNELPASDGFAADSACPWGWRTSLYRTPASGIPNFDDIYNTWDKSSVSHPLMTFNANVDSLKNETAALDNNGAKYSVMIGLGFAPDVDKAIADSTVDDKKAGIEKVQTEIQKQADEFMKSMAK